MTERSRTDALLNSVHEIYIAHSDENRRRPITAYIQFFKILFYIVGLVLIVTTILERSPVVILGGIGGLSAVLLLIFRDTILALAAGFQLRSNKTVNIGDWIEMPKYGADGTVIDVTLQSVIVQNFDKTLSTIPVYSLVSEGVKNWRGMRESGGRRIKRAIYIDTKTIKFCAPEMIDRFKRYSLIRDYVVEKEAEISTHNADREIDASDLLSSRRMTNLGTFRAFLVMRLERF